MRRMILPVVAAVAAGVACGGGGGDGDDAGFVTSRLAQVPAAIGTGELGRLDISMLDAVELAERRGLGAPSADRTGVELARWAIALSYAEPGGDALIRFFPGVLDENMLPGDEEFTEATGIALGAVETIVNATAVPDAFTVLTGDITIATDLPEVVDGVRTYGEGDDFSTSFETQSWNALGSPMRFATRDGAVAAARSTPLAAQWAAGVEESLADDPSLGPIGRVLDEYRSFSAYLVMGSFAAEPAPRMREAEFEAYLATVPDVAPYTAIGAGIAVVDDEPRTIVAYAFANEDDAIAAVDPLAAAWTDGIDLISGRPISERLSVVGSRNVGQVTVVELEPVDDGTTQDAIGFQGSTVFVHP